MLGVNLKWVNLDIHFGNLEVFLHIFQSFYKVLIVIVYVILFIYVAFLEIYCTCLFYIFIKILLFPSLNKEIHTYIHTLGLKRKHSLSRTQSFMSSV